MSSPSPAILFNEIEPFAVEWLRNLSLGGMIAPGTVDPRSIVDLRADDVRDQTQFHTFAGIGVWSYALRMAGWPDDAPVWTGSCPCQPFSVAGKKKGITDERHLWPEWFRLIRECRPPIIFGEQVASPDGLAWLDAVSADVEGAGYSFGASDLCAAGVGAPHIRQRLYFVAVADDDAGSQRRLVDRLRSCERPAWANGLVDQTLADTEDYGHPQWYGKPNRGEEVEPERLSDAVRLGDAYYNGTGRVGRARIGKEAQVEPRTPGSQHRGDRDRGFAPSATCGFWSPAEWLWCRDGVYRPTQPGLLPLVDGAAGRVGRIRAYGNAIVPQVAATFVRAVMDSLVDHHEEEL